MTPQREDKYRHALRIMGIAFGMCGLYLLIKSVMPVEEEQKTEDVDHEEIQQQLLNEAKRIIKK